MSFFKRLFGKKQAPAESAPPEVVEEEVVYLASPHHFAIIEAPAPVDVDEPLAEPQPTVESPALTAEDLTFSAGPAPEEEVEPEPEEPLFVAEAEPEPEPEPEPTTPPEPDAPIALGRLSETDVLQALERALDELGSAHHRPFSRG